MIRGVAALVGAVVVAGCSVVGDRSGTEQVGYEVVERRADGIEIRRYAPRMAVQADLPAVDSSRAFRLLFDYISGENRGATEIAMTAPVSVDRTAEAGMRMRFFLPASFTPETTPQPRDSRLSVHALPGDTQAVRRFDDPWVTRDSTDAERRLLAGLAQGAWRPAGPVAAYYYDPPWTLPFLRRNEVAVAVVPRETAETNKRSD